MEVVRAASNRPNLAAVVGLAPQLALNEMIRLPFFVTGVSISDPAHPLFGQTLPVVQESSPRGQSHLIVSLPNGDRRSIPRYVAIIVQVKQPVVLLSYWTSPTMAYPDHADSANPTRLIARSSAREGRIRQQCRASRDSW